MGELFGISLVHDNRWNGFKTLRERWTLGPDLAMHLEGTRREPASDGAPGHGIGFGLMLRW